MSLSHFAQWQAWSQFATCWFWMRGQGRVASRLSDGNARREIITVRGQSSPRNKGGGYTLAGRSGGGGSIFWKTRDIGLPSYSNNLSTVMSDLAGFHRENIFNGGFCNLAKVWTLNPQCKPIYVHLFSVFFFSKLPPDWFGANIGNSVVDPDPHHLGNLDLDPHQGDLPYLHPDPYQI